MVSDNLNLSDNSILTLIKKKKKIQDSCKVKKNLKSMKTDNSYIYF